MDPPIDPALLEEEWGGEENDLEDAEGELVDEMMESEYANYGGYPNVEDHQQQQPIQENQDFGDGYQQYWEYPENQNVYAPHPEDYSQMIPMSPSAIAGPSQPRHIHSVSPIPRTSPEDHSITAATPVIHKKRGRPFKNPLLNVPLPNGEYPSHKARRGRPVGSTTTTYMRRNKGSTKTKGQKTDQQDLSTDEESYATRDPDKICSMCYGPDEKNRKGEYEKMLWCHRCKRAFHPSCVEIDDSRLKETVFTYDWKCLRCKGCEVCKEVGDEDRFMFCDGCDRGWHSYCLNPPLPKPPKGRWICAKCPNRNRSALTPPATSFRDIPTPNRPSSGYDSPSVTASHPKPRGRPRKSMPTLSMRVGQDDDDGVFQDRTPKIKLKTQSSGRRGRPPKHSMAPSDTEDDEPPRTGMKIRLRVPSGGRRKTVEVESEEEKVPYGGVITGADADMSKTTITERDKEIFEKARLIAETKLGGPPPEDDSVGTPLSPAPSGSGSYFPSPGPATPAPNSLHRPLRDRLLQSSLIMPSPTQRTPGPANGKLHHGEESAIAEKIKKIRFGVYDIDTWYSAPYPEEYQHVPEGRLWLCEFCLKYMKSGFVSERHRMKCKAKHPPGDEIYRKDNVSVFEVDGRKNKIYCQNLCLLAKMFLDHKTLYYDVEPFLFYVMTEIDDIGARFVGYFSKEKRSPDNNVSCIMTLPVRQRKGWGQLLIDFSYLLSKKEERVGGPERPLSGLGEVTYKKYWCLSVFRFLRNSPDNPTLEDISKATSMTLSDVYSTLKDQNMIEETDVPPPPSLHINGTRTHTPVRRGRGRGRGSRLSAVRRTAPRPAQIRSGSPEKPSDAVVIPDRYIIKWDRDYVEAVLKKHDSRGYLELAPERLKYHPFLVTRNPTKLPGALAKATLAVTNGTSTAPAESADEPMDIVVPTDNNDNDKDAVNGDSQMAIEETVLHGEDRATLDLVAALSHQSPQQRRLRKRTSSELNTPAPNSSMKRLRNSERLRTASASASPSRRTSGRVRSNGTLQHSHSHLDEEPFEEKDEEEVLSDDSDDPLRLGAGLNGTPKRGMKSIGTKDVTPRERFGANGSQRGSARKNPAPAIHVDDDEEEEEQEEVEEEKEEELSDADADGEADDDWIGDEDAEGEDDDEDAEGEDDDEYEE